MTEARDAQAFSVKRAEVEFHNFASLGQPDRAVSHYALQNVNRGGIIQKHREFIGPMTPFLEIGSNVGHTSYLLANEFAADGFALDLSADSLRHGVALQDAWGYRRAPVRIAGDALNLPFADGSLRFVMAFQMLSQFMNIESVFLEVKRVLAPGGVFLFGDEPLRRALTLRLYRCPYVDAMKPWERKLFEWGVLGYLVRDVIGAQQEESFGIRQNHTMGLHDWHALVKKHFEEWAYDIFVPEHGWAERVVKRFAVRLDPLGSVWRAARLLGGTVTGVCRKAGSPSAGCDFGKFESLLRCPDCHAVLARGCAETLRCVSCGYAAALEGGVYNLLRSADRAELYPGDRPDIMDCSVPGHEHRLLSGWHDLEGVFGNKWRWIGERAEAMLTRVKPGPLRLRIRGSAMEGHLPAQLTISVNGSETARCTHDRPGLFIFECDVPDAREYRVTIDAAPLWRAPRDERPLSVNLSMIRLVPRE
jgi:SAM-dependent methyltransferase